MMLPLLPDCVVTKSGTREEQLASAWRSIVQATSELDLKLEARGVVKVMRWRVLTRVGTFMNAQVMNTLLLTSDGCTRDGGKALFGGLHTLYEQDVTGSRLKPVWDALKPTRDAVNFLVYEKKGELKSLVELRENLCASLGVNQLKRLVMCFDNNAEGVLSKRCLSEVKGLAVNGGGFLVDEEEKVVGNAVVTVPDVALDRLEVLDALKDMDAFSFLMQK